MTRKSILLIFSLALLICSCSTIKLKGRNGKDKHLDKSSFDTLSGSFKNTKNETVHFQRTLCSNFDCDTVYSRKNLIINFTPIDQHEIKLKVLDNEFTIDSITIKGKYRRGYFKVRRQWSTSFIVGPLVWILGDNFKYIGLTNEDNLFILNSGSGGVMLFVAFPIFGAGSGQFENEYERIK
jgi:hypothetical protein